MNREGVAMYEFVTIFIESLSCVLSPTTLHTVRHRKNFNIIHYILHKFMSH